MNNNSFDTQHDQFVISFDLLQLMEWIVEHNPEGLKEIIAHAMSRGKQQKKSRYALHDGTDSYSPDDAQHNIVDFLSLMESFMVEVGNEQAMDTTHQKLLLPAIDHVDTSICDEATLRSSVAVATHRSDRRQLKNTRELFLKELLKRWKPLNTEEAN